MKRTTLFSITVVLLLLTLALVFAIAPSRTAVEAETGWEDQIYAASAAWDEAFNAEDLDTTMTYYADNAVSMPPGFPALEGKEMIRADFEYIFDTFDLRHKTNIVDLLRSGNVVIERGQYEMRENGIVFETGKHIVVRQNLRGSWLVVWEIWNTDS